MRRKTRATHMRFSLIDLLIPIAFVSPGTIIAARYGYHPVLGGAVAYAAYFTIIGFIYRRLRLPPLKLPSCACCSESPSRFQVQGSWPRLEFLCPSCKGRFVIWMSGDASGEQTWCDPVIELRWPYIFGRYVRVLPPNCSKDSSL